MSPPDSDYTSRSEKEQHVTGRDSYTRELPSGTVTFLFTDIEGSTRLAQEYAEEMPVLLGRHHKILNRAIAAHSGFVLHITGDSFAVAFHDAADALDTALEIQRALYQEVWSPAPIKVRIGIHTGAAQLRDAYDAQHYSEYATIATAQRVMAVGHGGQILLSHTSTELIRDHLPAGIGLVDMHERRLKDIARPVHIYQVTAPDLPSEFAPLSTADAVIHNLPAQLTPFIGRKEELAALQLLLADKQKRLITIVAPGGMGKTRLSLETAANMVETFTQGLYFVELDRINSAEMIAEAVAEVLPISLSSNEDPKSRIVDYLHDKTILLVLDNFEHILDGAAFVQEILTLAPRLNILVTSRTRLNLFGETVFSIEGLAISEHNPEQNSAVQLFTQHARQVYPAFELDEAVLPDVVRICRLVDGMPLAIVLAAAWIATLSVGEIAAEIENSLDILETELRDVPFRQRSVRAVIESSWNQLDTALQEILKRLSVFRGGFTRTAAQKTTGASLIGLAHLVDKALLRRDLETGRYSIHELLRQYAADQLAHSAVTERSAHQAHANYFADYMKMQEAQLHDQRAGVALREIEADFDNIRIALYYWANEQDAVRIVEFIGALWLFFEVRGSFLPAIQIFGNAARKLNSSARDIIDARAQLQARQAWFTALIGLPEEGLSLAQKSINTLSQFNELEITVETLHCVSINAIFLNRNEIVVETSQKMMARASRSGDIWERGWALVWLAYTRLIEGQVDEALQSGQEALAIFEGLENPYGASVASGLILGSISLATGQTSLAKSLFSRGLKWAEEINYLRLLQINYDSLGSIAMLEGDLEQAEQLFLKSLRVSQTCGQTREMLASLRDLANVYIARGDLEGALILLTVVLKHPASEQNSLNRPEPLREETEKLRAQIEMQLGPSRYRVAWTADQQQNLAEIVARILP